MTKSISNPCFRHASNFLAKPWVFNDFEEDLKKMKKINYVFLLTEKFVDVFIDVVEVNDNNPVWLAVSFHYFLAVLPVSIKEHIEICAPSKSLNKN